MVVLTGVGRPVAAEVRRQAAEINPMCENACGRFPR
jgi:hypothetical protein